MDAPVPSLRDRPIHPSDLPIVMQNADELQELNPELNRVEAERLASQNVNEAIGLAQAGLSYYNPISQQATITTSTLVPQSTFVSSKPQKEFPTLIPSSSKKVKELLKKTIKQLKESPTVEDTVKANNIVQEIITKEQQKELKSNVDIDRLLDEAEEIMKNKKIQRLLEKGKKAYKLPEEKAYKLPEEKAYKLPEEKAYKLPEEKAYKLPEEKAYKFPEEKAYQFPEAYKFPEEKAYKFPEEKAYQFPEAYKFPEEKAYQFPEEKAYQFPEEKAYQFPEPQQVIEVGSYRPDLVFQDNRVIDRQTGKRITKDKLINLISQFRKEIADEGMTARELLTTYNIVSGKAGLQAHYEFADYPQLMRIKTKQQQKEYADLYGIPYDENESIKDFQTRVAPFTSGKGFKPLSTHPNHIISGIMHFVTHKNRMINRNEYNRENAQNLIQEASKKAKGEGFFSDLKDKLGMWLFKNVHPAGRMMTYVQESMKK
jgi:hypothetical protein